MRAGFAWMGVLLAASCFVPGTPRVQPEEYIAGIRTALRSGNVEQARILRDRARQTYPQNGLVLWWCATVSILLWEDQRALAELRAMQRSQDRGGMTEAQCAGLVGDLLFQSGAYADSIPHLRAGQVGVEGTRRKAFAELAQLLPLRRKQAGPLATELPLQDGNLPELIVTVGGSQRPFVLDTGTSMTTISRSLATELKVSPILPAGMAADGTGEPIPVAVGAVSEFEIGDIGLGALPVLVVEDQRLALRDFLGGPPRSAGGVVGLDILSEFRMTLDPERQSVILELPRGLPQEDSIRCVHFEGRCLAPVAIEGRTMWFVLDTGASHSSLTRVGLEALPGGQGRATETFRRVRTASGGTVAVREVRDLVLRVSEVRFRGISLPVIERQSGDLFPVHGVMGADLLLRCRMTLDRGRAQLEAPPENRNS